MTWKPATEIVNGRARRNYSAYRKAVTLVTQKRIAELVEVSAPTLSDFDDMMERACLVLGAAGLKIVGENEQTVEPDDMRQLLKESIRHRERLLADLGDTRPADL